MSYQQPPEQRANRDAGAPPGWYPDPGGHQALRWWDGAQWSQHTQPPPSAAGTAAPPHPNAVGPASGRYGTSRQDITGAPQNDTAYSPDPGSEPSSASFPAGAPEQPAPFQPYGWPQQQAYAPGLQPQGHRAPRRPGNRTARRALIGLGILIGIAAVIGVALASYRSPSARNAAATSTASAAAPATSASQPDCNSQLISWRGNGGSSQIEAVATDMGNLQQASSALDMDMSTGADSSGDEASLQTAAASLQSDAETAQANLPPSCVPDMSTDEGAALNDASKAALDCQDAVSEMGSGNYNVAADDMNAANAAITASGKKFQAATSDLQALSNG